MRTALKAGGGNHDRNMDRQDKQDRLVLHPVHPVDRCKTRIEVVDMDSNGKGVLPRQHEGSRACEHSEQEPQTNRLPGQVFQPIRSLEVHLTVGHAA